MSDNDTKLSSSSSDGSHKEIESNYSSDLEDESPDGTSSNASDTEKSDGVKIVMMKLIIAMTGATIISNKNMFMVKNVEGRRNQKQRKHFFVFLMMLLIV